MNKYAAEKIAQEYYTIGLELALEKVAGFIDKGIAQIMAKNFAEQMGQASKLTREAGSLRRLSGKIPGTKMHNAQKIMNHANNADRAVAENVHNLGFDQSNRFTAGAMRQAGPREAVLGVKQKVKGPNFTNASQRYHQNLSNNQIPRNYEPRRLPKTLSQDLRRMPDEQALRELIENIQYNKRYDSMQEAVRARANYKDFIRRTS